MEDKEMNPRTPKDRRFLEVIAELIQNGTVKSGRALLMELKIDNLTLLNRLKKGDFSVQDEYVTRLSERYNISEEWIKAGTGEKYTVNQVTPEAIEALKNELSKLKKELENKDKILSEVLMENRELRKRLDSSNPNS
jgi:hypothetical protein